MKSDKKPSTVEARRRASRSYYGSDYVSQANVTVNKHSSPKAYANLMKLRKTKGLVSHAIKEYLKDLSSDDIEKLELNFNKK